MTWKAKSWDLLALTGNLNLLLPGPNQAWDFWRSLSRLFCNLPTWLLELGRLKEFAAVSSEKQDNTNDRGYIGICTFHHINVFQIALLLWPLLIYSYRHVW